MSKLKTTCWTMIAGAASGRPDEQERFVATYGRAIRDFLIARSGRGTPVLDIEDAVQEVYLECLREGGALEKANPHRPGGFRPFLFGVVRNVARRIEGRRAGRREVNPHSDLVRNGQTDVESDPRHVFDRSWARTMVREARARLRERATEGDEAARRQFELLRLRYEEGKPVRVIATEWGEPAQRLHHELGRAKKAFQDALRQVVAFHLPGTSSEIDHECRALLALLARKGRNPPSPEARNHGLS